MEGGRLCDRRGPFQLAAGLHVPHAEPCDCQRFSLDHMLLGLLSHSRRSASRRHHWPWVDLTTCRRQRQERGLTYWRGPMHQRFQKRRRSKRACTTRMAVHELLDDGNVLADFERLTESTGIGSIRARSSGSCNEIGSLPET